MCGVFRFFPTKKISSKKSACKKKDNKFFFVSLWMIKKNLLNFSLFFLVYEWVTNVGSGQQKIRQW